MIRRRGYGTVTAPQSWYVVWLMERWQLRSHDTSYGLWNGDSSAVMIRRVAYGMVTALQSWYVVWVMEWWQLCSHNTLYGLWNGDSFAVIIRRMGYGTLTASQSWYVVWGMEPWSIRLYYSCLILLLALQETVGGKPCFVYSFYSSCLIFR